MYHVCRSGKQGKLTVRTQDEDDDVQTGESLGIYSVLDLTYNTKFFVGGVVGQAVDVVSQPGFCHITCIAAAAAAVVLLAVTVFFSQSFSVKSVIPHAVIIVLLSTFHGVFHSPLQTYTFSLSLPPLVSLCVLRTVWCLGSSFLGVFYSLCNCHMIHKCCRLNPPSWLLGALQYSHTYFLT